MALQTIQMQVIILLGPPGAGKGSQALRIREKLGIAHISTGELLRNHIGAESALGRRAKEYIEMGQLVPDSLIFDMLFTRIAEPDCQQGYLLDGFPRNLAQAQELQERLKGHPAVAINLRLDDSTIVERITKRLICKGCQTPHHLIYSPPKTAGKCDKCGQALYQRSDDTREVVEARLKVYREETAPLSVYYRELGAFHEIDGARSQREVFQDIMDYVEDKQNRFSSGSAKIAKVPQGSSVSS